MGCHCFNQRLIPKKSHCFGRKKTFMPAVSFASLLPLGDTTIRHELLGFFGIFWDFKSSGSKPNRSTPQIANSEWLEDNETWGYRDINQWQRGSTGLWVKMWWSHSLKQLHWDGSETDMSDSTIFHRPCWLFWCEKENRYFRYLFLRFSNHSI